MKREIKFRAWDKKNSKMINYIPVLLLSENAIWTHDLNYFHNTQQWIEDEGMIYDPILMQYTGLKDKNGKEIYEGDITNYGIIKWFNELCWDGSGSCHPGFYFKNGGIHQENDENYIDMDWHIGFEDDIEIIGNIYENPELC
jgi:uncharacterized phage protein (TIGR01671 family)